MSAAVAGNMHSPTDSLPPANVEDDDLDDLDDDDDEEATCPRMLALRKKSAFKPNAAEAPFNAA